MDAKIPAETGPSRVVTGGLVILAALALAAVAYESDLLHKLRLLTESQDAALSQSESDLRMADRRLQGSVRRLTELNSHSADSSSPENKRAAAPPAARAQSREFSKADAQRFLASDPSLPEMVKKVARMQYQTLYGPFFRQQNLSPQQIDQLMNAAVETWTQTMAIRPGGGINTEQQPSAEVLTSIIGADGYQRLLSYQRSIPAMYFTQGVATEAGYSSAPLTSAQQDGLTEAIARASESYQSGQGVDLGTVNWDSVRTQIASAGLSPAQSDALERMIVTQQYHTALQEATRAQNLPK